MMVGILTLHEADNYGAVLQAYALQRTLEKLGAECEFLSLVKAQAQQGEEPSGLPAALIGRIRQAGGKRAALFDAFRRRWLHCAGPVPWAEAARSVERYDRLIVGSDQVWNPRISGVDERYFLPFAPPDKRFSYAASFGAEPLPESIRDWCAGELRRFAGLSVRERSGRDLLMDLTGREALVCLDPTLLLSREEWAALAGPEDEKAYVLLYLLKYDASLAAAAKKEAAGRGLPLRTVTAAYMPPCGFDAWCGVGVEKWASLFRNASCVFTNSFHGTAFSLLFSKPLRTARIGGELQARNGRTEELLQSVGLDPSFDGMYPAVPAETFSACIRERRETSVGYLKEIVRKESGHGN